MFQFDVVMVFRKVPVSVAGAVKNYLNLAQCQYDITNPLRVLPKTWIIARFLSSRHMHLQLCTGVETYLAMAKVHLCFISKEEETRKLLVKCVGIRIPW